MQRTVLVLLSILAVSGCDGSKPQPAASDSSPPAIAGQSSSMPEGAHNMPRIPATLADWAQGATLFDNLGTFHRKIATTSTEAQQYFDQGMRFLWAFNHDESTRSFAQRRRTRSAVRDVLLGCRADSRPQLQPADDGGAARQGRVGGIATRAKQRRARNAGGAGADRRARAPLSQTRSRSIRRTRRRCWPPMRRRCRASRSSFPDDIDVQTLYAEATDEHQRLEAVEPGRQADRRHARRSEDAGMRDARAIRSIPARTITTSTRSRRRRTRKAVASAERLRGMMPAAGHLEHMPAHILQRVGRYAEAAAANRKGADAD